MGGRESTTLPNPRERDKQPKQTPKQTPTTTYLDERVTPGVEDFVFEVRGRQRRDRGRGKSTATQQQQHKERRHGTAQHVDVMGGIGEKKMRRMIHNNNKGERGDASHTHGNKESSAKNLTLTLTLTLNPNGRACDWFLTLD